MVGEQSEDVEPVENNAFAIFSQFDLSDGDETLVPAAQAKIAALKKWVNSLPDVPSVLLSDLSREELYK